MKGFMRQRGASWELRVFLGRDPGNPPAFAATLPSANLGHVSVKNHKVIISVPDTPGLR